MHYKNFELRPKVQAILLLACFLTNSIVATAQPGVDEGCLTRSNPTALKPVLNTSCGFNSGAYNNFFKLKESFIPQDGETTPVSVTKKVKIRLVVLESDPNSPVQTNYRSGDISQLNYFVQRANYWLANIAAPSQPIPAVCGSCHIVDSRIRVELTEVDFVTDLNAAPLYDPYGDESFQNMGKYKDSILNVYFVFNPDKYRRDSNGNPIVDANGNRSYVDGAWTTYSNPFSGSDDNSTNYICFRNQYKAGSNMDGEARRFVHELGHCMGNMRHTYGTEEWSYGHPDYLNDIFGGNNPPTTPYAGPTNNFMDQEVGYYYSPMQLGRFQRQLFQGSSKRYIYPTEAPTAHPWVITSGGENWDFGIRMYQDIRIKPGAILTIKCEVQMPPDARIIIEPGGTLIVDGGRLTSYHGRASWQGIEIVGNMNQPSNPAYQGYLRLKNGAVIENAVAGVRNFTGENGAQGGGIINAVSSHFYNCRRSVELNGYGNYSYGNMYSTSTNCFFDHVDFVNDENDPFFIGTNGEAGAQFTSYDTKDGVLIQNCTFRNEVPYSLQPAAKRGRAIGMAGTGVKVSKCTFYGHEKGIYMTGVTGIPTRTAVIHDNSFDYTTAAITIANTAYSDIQNNKVTNLQDYTIPGQSPMVARGIYLDQTLGAFVGCNNKIDGLIANTSFRGHYGIVVNSSGTVGAVVKGNNLTNLLAGVQTQRHNPNLTIFCNYFSGNNVGLAVNPQSNSSFFWLKDQGTGCASTDIRAGNRFASNTSDITSYLTNQLGYYAFTSNSVTDQYPSSVSGNVYVSNCPFGTATTDPNTQCNNFWDCVRIAPGTGTGTSNQAIRKQYGTLVGAGLKASLDAQLLRNLVIQGYNEEGSVAGLQGFLESENDDNARRMLIPLYIETAQTSKVANTIAQMAVSRNEKIGYANYYNIIANLQQQGRSINALDPQELQIVRSLATADLEVSGFAKAILEWSYNEPWEHPVEEAGAPPARKSTPRTVAVATEASKLYDATPNPAGSSTVIKVSITEEDALLQPILTLHSISGKEMGRYPLKAGMNNISISTAQYTGGLYVFSLSLNGKVRVTKKLSVVQ